MKDNLSIKWTMIGICRDVASWVVPHAERPRFPSTLLRRTRWPDTSLKTTLWMKVQQKGHWHPCASSRKTHRFHIQLYKRPVTPWTTRDASGFPFLHTRWVLTLLSHLCRNMRSESEMKRKPDVPALSKDDAFFHFTKPSGVPRGHSQLHSIPDFT